MGGWRGVEWSGVDGEDQSNPSLPLSPPLLSVFGAAVVAESTAGALLSLTLNGERSWKFRVPGQIYLDRLSFEVHTCGRVKDTWCILDVLKSTPSIRVTAPLSSKIAA